MAHFGAGSNTKFYPFTWMMPKGGDFDAHNYNNARYAVGGGVKRGSPAIEHKLIPASCFPAMMDTPLAFQKSAQFNFGKRYGAMEPSDITNVTSGKSAEAIQKMDYSNYYNDRK